MPRDDLGKFALKNGEHRCVRSLRLTDTTWSALGALAESRALTRADLLEQMFASNDHPYPSNTRLERELLPRNTWRSESAQPRNTWQKEEIRRLKAEIAHLRAENAKLVENLAEKPTQVNDLEAIRDRVLSSLKLGKQAPGYKTAKLALNQFMQLLRAKI